MRIAPHQFTACNFPPCWGRKRGHAVSPARLVPRPLSGPRFLRRDRARCRAGARPPRPSPTLEQRLAGYKPVAQARPARPAVCRQGRAAAARPLHSRRGRPRQDHADGHVFSAQPGRAQAPRAFPRIHGRGARADPRLSSEYRARRDRRRRRDRAHRRVDFRRGLAFVLRRIPCHRHRRCDDPRDGCSPSCSNSAPWWWRHPTSRPRISTRAV